MYIRRVPTRNNTTGESYFTHRLARTERVANMVRQITLLDLGRHFAVAQEDWPSLCPAQSLSRRCPCHAPVPPARRRTPPPASPDSLPYCFRIAGQNVASLAEARPTIRCRRDGPDGPRPELKR